MAAIRHFLNSRNIAILAVFCLIISFVASSYIVWLVFTSEEERGPFYGSSQGNIYHYSWCSYVNKTKAENLIKFSTALEADIRGYNPCDICDPPGPSDPHVVEIIIAGLVPAYIGLIISLVTLFRNNPINNRPQARQENQNNIQQFSRNKHSDLKIQKIITIILVTTLLATPIIGPVTAEAQYIGSKERNLYHLPTCQYVKQIKPENKIEFANEQEASDANYSPCSKCINVNTKTPTDSPTVTPSPTPEIPLIALIAEIATVSTVIILIKKRQLFKRAQAMG